MARISPRVRGFLGAALATVFLISCGVGRQSGRDTAKTPDGSRVQDVATSRPDPGTLHRTTPVENVQRLPEVASVGDCAPRHAHASDSRTACVENRPCRGFGVRDESGSIFCTCYGKVGGCAEGQRCDLRKLSCVPEEEPPGEKPREP